MRGLEQSISEAASAKQICAVEIKKPATKSLVEATRPPPKVVEVKPQKPVVAY